MKRITTIIALCLFANWSFAQDYPMDGNPITDCKGFFQDSGGNGGSYGPNENFTTTICSDNSTGTHISLLFANSNIIAGDALCFFDGLDTSAPPLGCASDFTDSYVIQASAENPTGCVTVTFNSDGNGQGLGWSAVIDCVPSCQRVEAVITATIPPIIPVDTGYIDVCPGEPIRLSAVGFYPQNDFAYHQSDSTSKFSWDYGDGTSSVGPNAFHIYNEPGGYIIGLTIEDEFGCENVNFIKQRVRVSTKPNFNLGEDIPTIICAGDTVSLTASVQDSTQDVTATPTPSSFDVEQIRADTLFVEDIEGLVQPNAITFTEFSPGQVLTNIDDLVNICVNMEHSYLRDLEIKLKCPDGTEVILHNFAGQTGGAVFLGEPVDGDGNLNPGQGLGYQYCWTPNATAGTWIEYSNANTPGTLPAGDYESFDPLTNLVGCPLNGEWELIVVDGWPADNGWIFSWSILFRDEIYPDIETFTPNLVDYSWLSNPTVYFSTPDSIAATPPNAGFTNYIFEVTDDFGCTYDTSFALEILPPTHPDCHECEGNINDPDDAAICSGASVTLDASFTGDTNQEIVFEAFAAHRFDFDVSPPTAPYNSNINVNSVLPITLTDPFTQIESVCIDIDHKADEDIDVFLRAPNGVLLELTTDNGGLQDNYTMTCFTPNATNPITGGAAPFTGDFQPEGDWNILTGAPVNGTWTLLVSDDQPDFKGTFNSWTITFNSTNDISYTWTPATDLSCDDCPIPTASPTTTTTYVVLAMDSYSCENTESVEVTVANNFPAPDNLMCGESINGTLTFNWDPVPGATAYEVSINGQAWEAANGTNSHTVSGLSQSDVVSISVRVLNTDPNCSVGVAMQSCTYLVCDISVSVNGMISPSCYNVSDGTIFPGIVGTFATPFTYYLNGVEYSNTSILGNVAAGDYTLVVVDGEGCRDSIDFTLDGPDSIAIALTTDSVTCNGAADGAASALASGGFGDFDYRWNTQPFTTFNDTITGLSPGTYIVTATDDNTCEIIDTVEIFEPPLMMVSAIQDSVNCTGGADGQATAIVSGGAPPYSFSWTGGSMDSIATGLSAGNVDLLVTDANNCSMMASVTILEPTNLNITLDSTNVTCNGGSDGTATVTVTGGSGGFSFQWCNGQTGATATGLPAGQCCVVIQDDSGCDAQICVTLEEPTAIDLSNTSSTVPGCVGGTDGTATVTPSGGTTGYMYQWDLAAMNQTTGTAVGLSTGNYKVTVTDGVGCQDSTTVTVGAPTPITLMMSSTVSSCDNPPIGTATVVASGGTGVYNYEWELDAASQMTSTAINLLPGTYTVTVTDGNSCTAIDSVLVDGPDIPVIDAILSTPVRCKSDNSGSAFVVVSGGSGSYSYLWDDPLMQFSDSAVNLAAGTYQVIVTDNGTNCNSIPATIVVTEPDTLTATATSTDVNCFNGNDGTATVVPMGGTAPYSYLWSDPMSQGDSIATGLTQGNFTVQVQDINGCNATASVNLSQPASGVTTQINQTTVGCFGQSMSIAVVTPVGGTAPYTYLWSDGQVDSIATNLDSIQYTVVVTDAGGCSVNDTIDITEQAEITTNINFVMPSCFGVADGAAGVTVMRDGMISDPNDFTFLWSNGEQTQIINNLVGGQSYSVVVTDMMGCSATEEQILPQPNPISLDFTATDVSCSGLSDGQVVVTAQGDHNDYTYQWSANAAGQMTDTASNLAIGTYNVTVTDSTGCMVDSFITINEPLPLSISFNIVSNGCSGDSDGMVTAIVEGGTGGYIYNWSNGGTAATIENLVSGSYDLVVTDENACMESATAIVSQPIPLEATVSTGDPTCFGDRDGFIMLDAQGGIPPYQYSIDGENFNGSSTMIGLRAGMYTVFVQDNSGCTWQQDVEVVDPPEFVIDAGDDRMITLGDSTILNVDVIGGTGTGPFSFLWSQPFGNTLQCLGNDTFPLTCTTPRALTQNTITYSVYAIDGNGCEATDEITIEVDKNRGVFIPTAFTPNGDTFNDKLVVHGKSETINEIKVFRVYDRWGELMYEASDFKLNDPDIGWDGTFKGKELNAGVYVWYVEVVYIDGEEEIAKGNTTLLR